MNCLSLLINSSGLTGFNYQLFAKPGTLVAMLLHPLEFISIISICTLLIFVACSTTTTRTYYANPINQDTIYIVSTKKLQSTKIPDSVFQMTNLKCLGITGEDCDTRQFGKDGHDLTQCWIIKEIPKEIMNLKKLTRLRLTLNAIKIIPNELTQLRSLKSLDLTDNAGLINIDNLAKIQSLEYLSLYGCGLTKLPDNIGDLKNLKELGLVGNNLDKIERTRIRRELLNCFIRF